MYSVHVPIINAAMRTSPDVFARGVMFAILSARVQFGRVPAAVKELDARGAQASCLWGFKRGAYDYLQTHKQELWLSVCAEPDTTNALALLTAIPGLGIVKGAFVLQMLGHDVACLDVRNVQREGLKPREWRTDGKKTGRGYLKKVSRYVAQTSGRARELWDTWCAEVGPDYGMTALECSALHLRLIVPRSLRNLAPIAPQTTHAIPF